jgi:hypothetical protein
MAERVRARTIDPDRVGNVDAWLRWYKSNYANLVQRPSDGALMVLAPSTLDKENPVRTFPLDKGIDAVGYMIYGTDDKVRATAASHIEGRAKEQAARIASLEESYTQKEGELLEAVEEWKATRDPLITAQIGSIQLELESIDRERENARYPTRYVAMMDLKRSIKDYETGDQRLMPFPVYVGRGTTISVGDRTIPF